MERIRLHRLRHDLNPLSNDDRILLTNGRLICTLVNDDLLTLCQFRLLLNDHVFRFRLLRLSEYDHLLLCRISVTLTIFNRFNGTRLCLVSEYQVSKDQDLNNLLNDVGSIYAHLNVLRYHLDLRRSSTVLAIVGGRRHVALIRLLILLRTGLNCVTQYARISEESVLFCLNVITNLINVVVRRGTSSLPRARNRGNCTSGANSSLASTLLLRFLLRFLIEELDYYVVFIEDLDDYDDFLADDFCLIIFILFRYCVLVSCFLVVPLLFCLIRLSNRFRRQRVHRLVFVVNNRVVIRYLTRTRLVLRGNNRHSCAFFVLVNDCTVCVLHRNMIIGLLLMITLAIIRLTRNIRVIYLRTLRHVLMSSTNVLLLRFNASSFQALLRAVGS